MGLAVTIRDALFDAVEAARGAASFSYNGFYPEKTHKPFAKRESDVLRDGIVHIMAGAFDESIVNRGGMPEVMDVPILVFMQRSIDVDDELTVGDQFLNLAEEISDTARDLSIERLTWTRNVQMKDEQGYPYVFSLMRDQSVLQLGFTAHYHYNWTS